jgi:undecaprenyl-diphosphatase
MTPVQAIVLGAVQGITEFLPISSSAHLILVPWLFGWPDQGLTFDVVLHAGTLLAIVSFFWHDWCQMFLSLLPGGSNSASARRLNSTLFVWVACGTVPAAVVGFFAQKTIETSLRSPFLLSITLISVALLLWLADRTSRLVKDLAQVTLVDAMSIGCAQALALVPGTSRSGITITTGLFLGLTREAAARFSFLLSAPIIAGAGLKKLLDLWQAGVSDAERLPMALGFLSSLLVGYLTIKFLMRYLQRNTLLIFVCYRIALGMIILGLIQFAGFRP